MSTTAESTPAPPAPAVSAAPIKFTCENAATALGHPDWAVYACKEMPEPGGLFAVTLEAPDGARDGQMVPVDLDGFTVTGSGMSTASQWLRGRGLVGPSALTLTGLTNVLEAFDAYPPSFDINARSFSHDTIGGSTFTAEPFKLTLYTPHPQNRPPGPKLYMRAILELDEGGKLIWHIAEGMAEHWTEGESIPAE